MSMLTRFSCLAGLIALTGCATQPPLPAVMMRENNQYEVVGQGPSRAIARERAVQAANTTCNRGGYAAVIASDQERYNGVLGEQTGRVIDNVGRAVGAVTGIRTPTMTRDDDYELTLRFYCKKAG